MFDAQRAHSYLFISLRTYMYLMYVYTSVVILCVIKWLQNNLNSDYSTYIQRSIQRIQRYIHPSKNVLAA